MDAKTLVTRIYVELSLSSLESMTFIHQRYFPINTGAEQHTTNLALAFQIANQYMSYSADRSYEEGRSRL